MQVIHAGANPGLCDELEEFWRKNIPHKPEPTTPNFNKLGTDDLENLTPEQEQYLLEEKYQQEWIKKTQTYKRMNFLP